MKIEEIINSHKKGKCCCINLIARKRQCAGAKFISGKVSAEEAIRLAEEEKNDMEKEKGYALMQAFELLPYDSDDCITRPFFYYKAGTPLWIVKRGIAFKRERAITDYNHRFEKGVEKGIVIGEAKGIAKSIIMLYQSGISIAQIATAFKKSVTEVEEIINSNGNSDS